MSGQKRPSEAGGAAAGGSTAVETVIKLGLNANTEEQDIKALQVKNRKLGEALDQRQVIEDELRDRVERLETRQATDDASLLISTDTGTSLTRTLKPGTPEPDGDSNQERPKDRGHQGETATSFLATLASSSTEEMEAELQERLDSSQKQVTRVVELYEGLKEHRGAPQGGARLGRRGLSMAGGLPAQHPTDQ
ncbi:unnamed protein product [Boreogadus saida]